MAKIGLIVGAGGGISESVARALTADGYRVVLAARDIAKLETLCSEIGAQAIHCDASSVDSVNELFAAMGRDCGKAETVLYNASARPWHAKGPAAELDPDAVQTFLQITVYGAFLVAQQAIKGMQQLGHGSLFFTGATASIRGYPEFAPFAMGKFALRGLAQSLARELGPQGIHVAHFIIDGGVAFEDRGANEDDAMLEPDSIAETYMAVLKQHRSAWTQEIDLRPWVESF